jgi:hypothetical protein
MAKCAVVEDDTARFNPKSAIHNSPCPTKLINFANLSDKR